jgi:hypothetical protein
MVFAGIVPSVTLSSERTIAYGDIIAEPIRDLDSS